MEEDRIPESAGGGEWKGIALFAVIAAAALFVSRFTPLGAWLTVESVRALAVRLGVWGPLALAAFGALSPLLMLPRWPVAFVAGLLYGIVGGTALATVSSTLGAWLHFLQARTLLSPLSAGLLRRSGIAAEGLTPRRAFTLIFLLRAFPVSNFVATNLLAGALRLRTRDYLLATFLGMIPSTVMYASWGKLVKKPDPAVLWVAGGTVVLIVAGTLLARRLLRRWIRA